MVWRLECCIFQRNRREEKHTRGQPGVEFFRLSSVHSNQEDPIPKGWAHAMTVTLTGSRTPTPDGRAFSEQLYRIREAHIEVESILQSLAALQEDNPCARCTNVCCQEEICRESLDSDFLRFLLGPRVEGYNVGAGWYVPGSGCRLGHGRPLVCYEYFCTKFDTQDWTPLRHLSRAFKTLYAHACAGQHMLVVKDISRMTAHRLNIIHGRLENLRERANAELRRSLSEKLGGHATRSPVDPPGFPDPDRVQPE
jgi:hypothetical protein